MPTSRPNARSSSAICSYWDARSAKSKAQVRLPGRKVAAHVGTTGQQAMGDQGCPCSDCKPLDRAVRTGVRPKMPPRTAVPRAVPVVGLAARRALPNTTNSVLWVAENTLGVHCSFCTIWRVMALAPLVCMAMKCKFTLRK